MAAAKASPICKLQLTCEAALRAGLGAEVPEQDSCVLRWPYEFMLQCKRRCCIFATSKKNFANSLVRQMRADTLSVATP
jgi:hypothetical protein